MRRAALPFLGLLALATGGCSSGAAPATFGLPTATLVPLRLATCPAHPAAAASATHCPEVSR